MKSKKNLKKKIEKSKNVLEITAEQYEIIQKVAKGFAHKFQFREYSPEDIEQEAVLMSIKVIQSGKYDPLRPLENFLRRHLRNRLINLKRDNTRYNKPLNIADYEITNGDNFLGGLDIKITLEKIEKLVPAKFRADYLKMKAGAKIPTHRKLKLIEILRAELGIGNGGKDG